MRGLITATLKALKDCVYDAEREEFHLIFRDGRMYRLPQSLLPEHDGAEILSVLVERDGSAFVVQQRSGKSFEVPWDSVLHHLGAGVPLLQGSFVRDIALDARGEDVDG